MSTKNIVSHIKILISTHKLAELPQHEYFLPIQAGSSLSSEHLPYTPDNTGDNISKKNRNYCELTVHYWAWKNMKDTDIIGLNHYRRFFDFRKKFPKLAPDRRFTYIDDILSKPYYFPNLEEELKQYDIILPNTRNYPYDMATQYAVFHIVDDWRIMKDIIQELSPEYITAFEKTMEHRNYSSNYNMFITKWEYFAEYSEWLFKILFEVEKRCNISEYPIQARIFGYMSERLINVYVEYRNLRIKHVPLIVPIDNFKHSINPSRIRYNLWKIRNYIAFKIINY